MKLMQEISNQTCFSWYNKMIYDQQEYAIKIAHTPLVISFGQFIYFKKIYKLEGLDLSTIIQLLEENNRHKKDTNKILQRIIVNMIIFI